MTARRAALFGLLCSTSLLAAQRYPAEVAEYIERREICEHFRQEPWPEGGSIAADERRGFLAAQFERHCRGIDRQARALKEKFSHDRTVMERLERYEADIEAGQ